MQKAFYLIPKIHTAHWVLYSVQENLYIVQQGKNDTRKNKNKQTLKFLVKFPE